MEHAAKQAAAQQQTMLEEQEALMDHFLSQQNDVSKACSLAALPGLSHCPCLSQPQGSSLAVLLISWSAAMHGKRPDQGLLPPVQVLVACGLRCITTTHVPRLQHDTSSSLSFCGAVQNFCARPSTWAAPAAAAELSPALLHTVHCPLAMR